MSEKSPFLVFGATGTQGGAVLRRLIELGEPVRAAVSSSASKERRESQGIPAVIAPLSDADALQQAFHGVERAYLVLPVSAGAASATYVSNFLQAAHSSGAKFIVFEPRGSYPDESTDVMMFEAIRAMTQMVLNGPVSASVVRTTVYLDNLLGAWSLPMIESGMVGYPIPAGFRPGWMTADDTAQVIAALLQRADTPGEVFDVVSQDNPSGDEIAAALSAATGRTIRYQPLPIDQFAEGLAVAFGSPEVAGEIAKLYRYLAQTGASYHRTSDLSQFGVEQESLQAWVSRQRWSLS